MSLVQGGDSKLKCFGSLGFLTIEYLCIEKLGIGVAGFSSHFSTIRSTPFAISAWRPTVEGRQLIALLAASSLERQRLERQRGQDNTTSLTPLEPEKEFEFFQLLLNRMGEIMRRFCEQPSTVTAAERAEMLCFVEAFCALCGYSQSDEVVRATRSFIELETKANMNALTQAALRKVVSTPCFSPEIRAIMGSILSSTLRSAF